MQGEGVHKTRLLVTITERYLSNRRQRPVIFLPFLLTATRVSGDIAPSPKIYAPGLSRVGSPPAIF